MFQNLAIRSMIAIALGAIPGALSRYYITEWSKIIFGKSLAYYGTFFINVTGCFLIALFLTLNEERFQNWSAEVRLLIVTGFCGAYTTFSTYGLETNTLLQQGNLTIAIFYWAGSAMIGMLAIKLGVVFARMNKAGKREP